MSATAKKIHWFTPLISFCQRNIFNIVTETPAKAFLLSFRYIHRFQIKQYASYFDTVLFLTEYNDIGYAKVERSSEEHIVLSVKIYPEGSKVPAHWTPKWKRTK